MLIFKTKVLSSRCYGRAWPCFCATSGRTRSSRPGSSIGCRARPPLPIDFRPGLAETLPQSAYLQQEETPARQKTTWNLFISGLTPARFEKHFGVLFCWSIEKLGRAPLQVPVEERQRVGINDVVRPTFIDWP